MRTLEDCIKKIYEITYDYDETSTPEMGEDIRLELDELVTIMKQRLLLR